VKVKIANHGNFFEHSPDVGFWHGGLKGRREACLKLLCCQGLLKEYIYILLYMICSGFLKDMVRVPDAPSTTPSI
jgi:hypothetical protein